MPWGSIRRFKRKSKFTVNPKKVAPKTQIMCKIILTKNPFTASTVKGLGSIMMFSDLLAKLLEIKPGSVKIKTTKAGKAKFI